MQICKEELAQGKNLILQLTVKDVAEESVEQVCQHLGWNWVLCKGQDDWSVVHLDGRLHRVNDLQHQIFQVQQQNMLTTGSMNTSD